MTPKPVPVVSIAHIHMVRVSVREHAGILRDRLRRAAARPRSALLCADCETTLEVVARFLALLELYREGLVAFDQVHGAGGADRPLDRRRPTATPSCTSTSTPAPRTPTEPTASDGRRRRAATGGASRRRRG